MKNNYIIIGDSITYGIGDYSSLGYASMLKKHIMSKDNTKECSNFVHIIGIPGATSSDIKNKIIDIIKVYKNDDYVNHVILSIGINDNNIELYEKNINYIINTIIEEEIKLTILGLTMIFNGVFTYWENTNRFQDDLNIINKLDETLKKVCKESKIQYIELLDLLKKDETSDGLHPTSEGHKKIFERLLDEQIII